MKTMILTLALALAAATFVAAPASAHGHECEDLVSTNCVPYDCERAGNCHERCTVGNELFCTPCVDVEVWESCPRDA